MEICKIRPGCGFSQIQLDVIFITQIAHVWIIGQQILVMVLPASDEASIPPADEADHHQSGHQQKTSYCATDPRHHCHTTNASAARAIFVWIIESWFAVCHRVIALNPI